LNSVETLLQSKILIVDDEPVNVLLLEYILAAEGYQNVHSSTDPRQVQSLQQREQFDLILLDMRMPHMSGIDVMAALAEQEHDNFIPILVLTAQSDDETRVNALVAGAMDFLTKPFKNWEVLLRIHNMLKTRQFYLAQRYRADELEEKVRERTQEVRANQLKIVQRLGRAGEFRDNETGAHVIRMSRSCQLLALAAGLDSQRAELILFASPMHDVGKIGIPDDILLKPGKLTIDEFEIMKTHAQIGGEIIGDDSSELLSMARLIAVNHHEKWDGSGYPRGISGVAIAIESRIASICDVFDALMSERPYKQAWPVDEAVALISDQAGIHFDPELVATFLDILPNILQLREQYPDNETEYHILHH